MNNFLFVLGFLVFPILLLFNSFASLLSGKLFPIVLKFGYTCGPVDTVGLGNGKEWLTILIFCLLVLVKIFLKKPKNWLLFLLALYLGALASNLISDFIGSKPIGPCV